MPPLGHRAGRSKKTIDLFLPLFCLCFMTQAQVAQTALELTGEDDLELSLLLPPAPE